MNLPVKKPSAKCWNVERDTIVAYAREEFRLDISVGVL